jgi:hypothetical protein
LVHTSQFIQKENNPAVYIIYVGMFTGFAGMMGPGGASFIRILEELKLHVRAIAWVVLNIPSLLMLASGDLVLACCFYCAWFSWTYFQRCSTKQKISIGAKD